MTKTCLIYLLLLIMIAGRGNTAEHKEVELYIDQSTSIDRPRLRQSLSHAVKELSGIPNIKVRVIPFFDDGWNAEVAGEVEIPPAPLSAVDCGKPHLSDLARISHAQRIAEEAEFQRTCARRAEEQLSAYRTNLAAAIQRLQEIVDETLNRTPHGRCTDLPLARLARLHRSSPSGSGPSRSGPSSSGARAIVFTDLLWSCLKVAMYPADVIRGRIFIAPVPPVKTRLTAGEYFVEVEEKLRRVAPWARVIPASFDLSEVLEVLR